MATSKDFFFNLRRLSGGGDIKAEKKPHEEEDDDDVNSLLSATLPGSDLGSSSEEEEEKEEPPQEVSLEATLLEVVTQPNREEKVFRRSIFNMSLWDTKVRKLIFTPIISVETIDM